MVDRLAKVRQIRPDERAGGGTADGVTENAGMGEKDLLAMHGSRPVSRKQ